MNTCMGLFPNKTFFLSGTECFCIISCVSDVEPNQNNNFSGKLLFNDVLCGRDTKLKVSVPFCLVEATS